MRPHARQRHDKGTRRTVLAVSDTPSFLGFYTLNMAMIAYDLTARFPRKLSKWFEPPIESYSNLQS